ncbi:Autotransporter adhesin [Dyella jiangningensis]|uniref:YadA-like family protein n=1 Tax=Dyella sp. AtDHG13 TaxID=1938897 RepID=UPI000885FE9F|nr:YadA-like family protein [Dyella sp. AtDHG13]PXV60326.1 autotransporter adhesin [Dyella sp. AtDHG13]SDJ40876.1 Autotransporter adhesin [Dyella jiangningensis]
MNKIHRKVWSRALNQLVVVSELATSHRRAGQGQQAAVNGPSRRLRSAILAVLAIGGGAGWSMSAQAQSVDCTASPYNVYNSTASCMGYGATASGVGATALGSVSHADVLGAFAAGYAAHSSGQNGIAVGFQAYTTAINAIYIGARTVPSSGALSGGAIAIGTDVTASAGNAIAMGATSSALAVNTLALGYSSSADANSTSTVVIGSSAKAVGAQNAVVLGNSAQANNGQATALGAFTNATSEGATAVGLSTQSLGTHSTAVGWQAYATALNAVYLGARTVGTGASAESAVAIGTDVSSSGAYAIGMGLQANASQTDAIAIGRQALASGINSMYLGARPTAAAGSGATANNAIAVGIDVTASAVGATALGNFTVASGVNSVALGASTASAQSAVALGQASAARAAYSVAIGDTNTVAAGAGAGSIAGGHNSQVTGGTGAVALGSGQIANGNGAVAIGDPNTSTGNGAVTMGANNTANGDGAVAIGNTNNAQGQGSVALGNTSSALAAGAVAFGNAATANNAGDVALGSGSTTATAVGTPSVNINGTTYTFVGTNPSSTVSVGASGAERTITNVAAGRISGNSTDAINGSQLFATNQALEALNSTVTASTTHYYSVNDGGTAGGNYTNNGASGLNALAAGVGATATADNGTSLGQNTQSTVLGGVALGSGAVSDRAIAPTSGSITVGTHLIPYNTTDRNLLGAVSVGNATDFRQITNVADGTEDQDAVTLRQLKGAMSSFSVTPIKYFHANSSATDSAAVGAESVAIGPQTTVNGDNGIGMGNGAIVQQTAPGGTAIGGNALVNLADGVALGTNAVSNGIQAMALGAGAQAAFAGSVALGAGSTTEAAVGTPGTSINGTAYTFAGTTPGSTVSVGTLNAERTITHVAAGRIDGSSTDAINGSQLYATNLAVGSVGASVTNLGNTVTNLGNAVANSYGGNTTYDPATGAINTSISYGGNTYSSLQQVFNQIDTGGIKYFHANSNLADSLANGVNSVAIGPVSTANTVDAVSIGNGATAGTNVGDVALGAGSVTGAVVRTPGATIAGNSYTYAGATPNSTVSVGSTGNERTITNVAAGQVNGNSTDAINGSQLFATNQAVDALNNTVIANATHYYSVNDGGTAGGNYANNGASGVNAIAAGVGATASADSATSLGQNTQSTVLGGVALGSGAVSDRAIAPASGSILVGTNVVPYNTTDRNLLGAVSVGNATDFRQITNVADGTQDQDAVTLRQLKGAMSSFSVTPIKYFHANSTASDSLAAGAESVAIGPQTTVNGDNGIGMGNGAIVQQTAPGGTAIGQDATVNLADGVALGTRATSNGIQAMALGAGTQADYAGSVALGAGSATAAAVGTASTTLNGTTYNFAGTTPGSTVSIGAAGAERTLTNLAAGRISSTSTDAINGSQLYATNQTLEQLGSQIINLSNTIRNLPPGGSPVTTTINTYQTSGDNSTASTATGNNATAAGAGSTASGNNSTAVGAGSTASGDNSVAVGAGSVASASNTVSVGSAGHERTVTNVANGVNATDAVNVGQLSDALTEAKNWSKDYVDQRFQTVDQQLNRIGNRANAGIASAMALASLPQAYQPNQSSAAVALGAFHGETGVAVGVSAITESGRYVFKLNATTNSRGDAGAGVGAGMVW